MDVLGIVLLVVFILMLGLAVGIFMGKNTASSSQERRDGGNYFDIYYDTKEDDTTVDPGYENVGYLGSSGGDYGCDCDHCDCGED